MIDCDGWFAKIPPISDSQHIPYKYTFKISEQKIKKTIKPSILSR